MVDARKKHAADQAWASCILEGFNPTQEEIDLRDRLVNEEISSEEYLRIVVERAREYEKAIIKEREKSTECKRVA